MLSDKLNLMSSLKWSGKIFIHTYVCRIVIGMRKVSKTNEKLLKYFLDCSSYVNAVKIWRKSISSEQRPRQRDSIYYHRRRHRRRHSNIVSLARSECVIFRDFFWRHQWQTLFTASGILQSFQYIFFCQSAWSLLSSVLPVLRSTLLSGSTSWLQLAPIAA